jgi:hypothetical protein
MEQIMSDLRKERKSSRRRFLGTTAFAAVGSPILTSRLAGFAPAALSLPILLARPTTSSILIHARNGQAEVNASAEVLRDDDGERVWQGSTHAKPADFLEWSVDGLKPGTRYR